MRGSIVLILIDCIKRFNSARSHTGYKWLSLLETERNRQRLISRVIFYRCLSNVPDNKKR